MRSGRFPWAGRPGACCGGRRTQTDDAATVSSCCRRTWSTWGASALCIIATWHPLVCWSAVLVQHAFVGCRSRRRTPREIASLRA
eukprot:5395164-Prymnesium_polylepis.1